MGGDLERAIALYTWNAELAGAFFEDLGYLEVVLRNALHEQLSAWHSANGRAGEWYDDPLGLLGQLRLNDIAKAKDQIAKNNQAVTPGKVVSELTLGFWRFLLDSRYQTTLWAQALQFGFPYLTPKDRRLVSGPVNALVRLRNRIAHHEPIHDVTRNDLKARHKELVGVVTFVDEPVGAWLASRSRVPAILGNRPV